MKHLENFNFFKKYQPVFTSGIKETFIKRAEQKIKIGEVKLQSSYFDGISQNKNIVIDTNDGTISFRKHGESYFLKYFPNDKNKEVMSFGIDKLEFEKYWDLCIKKGIQPKDETWIKSETKSRIGKPYKK